MSEEIIRKKLKEIIGYLDIKPTVDLISDEDTYKVYIEGDDLSFLIGYRGESLNALQTMLSSMVFNETNEWVHILVDINGYRDSRKDKLEEMAKSFIDRVRFHKAPVDMPPMNAFERRQVHMFVAEYPDILSESAGEGRFRHVVLKLKDN